MTHVHDRVGGKGEQVLADVVELLLLKGLARRAPNGSGEERIPRKDAFGEHEAHAVGRVAGRGHDRARKVAQRNGIAVLDLCRGDALDARLGG